MREHGIRGCYEYWAYSLNEEAADFKMMLNERDGWFPIEMRHCPSKGRLLALSHIKPYDKYCLHCDLYRKTVEKYGLCYDYDFTDTDRACCATLIYDPKIYRGRRIKTDDTLVMDRQAQDNRYLHREFHNYMSMGLEYLGTHFGQEAVEAYLRRFARNYYAPLIESIRKDGLAPLGEQIRETYRAEEAEDVAHIAPEGDQPARAHRRLSGGRLPARAGLDALNVVRRKHARGHGRDRPADRPGFCHVQLCPGDRGGGIRLCKAALNGARKGNAPGNGRALPGPGTTWRAQRLPPRKARWEALCSIRKRGGRRGARHLAAPQRAGGCARMQKRAFQITEKRVILKSGKRAGCVAFFQQMQRKSISLEALMRQNGATGTKGEEGGANGAGLGSARRCAAARSSGICLRRWSQ